VRFKVICVAAAVLFVAGSAVAQTDFKPLPGLSNLTIDLDSEDGRFSTFIVHDVCAISALKTQLQMPRIGRHSQYGPAATISLRNGDKHVALQVGGSRNLPLSVKLQTSTSDVVQVYARRMNANEKLDIFIAWTAEGDVQATVGGQTLTINLPGGVRQLHFSGSTGEAMFAPTAIGNTGTATGNCPVG